MRSRLIGCHADRMRACGALAEDGTDTCKKYISRSRWSRRKTRRGSRDV